MESSAAMMEQLTAMVQSLGLLETLFILFFFGAHSVIFLQYRARLNDRQKEIDRLAKDNHEYRDRFLAFVDRQMNLKPKKAQSGKTPRGKGGA